MKIVDDQGRIRWLGKYRGRVVDNDDPEKAFRIRCLIPDVFGNRPSVWCVPSLPPNIVGVPNVGDQVWVEFEMGDRNRPIYTGYTPTAGSGKRPAPPQQRGEDDPAEALLIGKGGRATTVEERDGEVVELVEPVSESRSRYGNTQALRVGSLFVEVDGTEGAERVQVYGPNGSYYEVVTSGLIRERSVGKVEWHQGNKRVAVVGSEVTAVSGDSTKEIRGQKTEIVGSGETKKVRGGMETFTRRDTKVVGYPEDTQIPDGAYVRKVLGKAHFSSSAKEEVVSGDAAEAVLGDRVAATVGIEKLSTSNRDNKKYAVEHEVKKGGYRIFSPFWEIVISQKGDITLSNKAGSIKLTSTGKVSITGASDEVLDLVSTLMQLLLSTTVPTPMGNYPLSITLDGSLAQLKARLDAIKGG